MNFMQQLIQANRSGYGSCTPSVCSAHPDVLAASCLLAKAYDRPLLIEATSNQVNQFGGYTGLLPADFIATVRKIATNMGYDPQRIVFGGDHLGPQAWRKDRAEVAMAHAKEMMAAYVQAGFTKIHLDCSEGCAGEPAQVSDTVSAARAAELAEVCVQQAPDPAALSFVIGTEVPPPGGARPTDEQGVHPTTAPAARATLAAQHAAFAATGNDFLWSRVIALVVQPGVEFSPEAIDHLNLGQPDELSVILPDYPGLCFEAHSTDYQKSAVFAELGRRHFAILKVGPALTHAYRKALYALSHLDQWLHGSTHISEYLQAKMQSMPHHWQGHYPQDDPDKLRQLLHFSYADRIRYYWAEPDISSVVNALLERLSLLQPNDFLLQAFIESTTLERANGLMQQEFAWHQAIIYAQIQEALAPYFIAHSSDTKYEY